MSFFTLIPPPVRTSAFTRFTLISELCYLDPWSITTHLPIFCFLSAKTRKNGYVIWYPVFKLFHSKLHLSEHLPLFQPFGANYVKHLITPNLSSTIYEWSEEVFLSYEKCNHIFWMQNSFNHINIYELILVCPWTRNMQVFSDPLIVAKSKW